MDQDLPEPLTLTGGEATQELEHFFCCPYCWSTISVLLDPGVTTQRYVEDCEVCCQPIDIEYRIQADGSVDLEARLPG